MRSTLYYVSKCNVKAEERSLLKAHLNTSFYNIIIVVESIKKLNLKSKFSNLERINEHYLSKSGGSN